MASSRDPVSIETLFSHELAPHPRALFDDSGEMRKTSKLMPAGGVQNTKQATSQGSNSGWLCIALDCSLASFTCKSV